MGAAAPRPSGGKESGLPVSSFPFVIGLGGVAALLIALFVIRSVPYLNLFFQPAQLALAVMIVAALGVFLPEFFLRKAYLRRGTGVWKEASPSWERTMTKAAGLAGSLLVIGFLYWLFPEYEAPFYKPYFKMLLTILPVWILLAVPYIWFVDARMAKPEDSLWHTGRLFMGARKDADLRRVSQYLLGWVLRAFFLPLIFCYLCQGMTKFLTANFAEMYGFRSFYAFFYDLFFLIDACLCAGGYLFAMRLTNTHIRSVDKTFLGWGVTLLCFEPFWTLINGRYLAYQSDYLWGNWLRSSPALHTLWGLLILALMLVYLSSTAAFGMRYSNLTHRGILTGGTYRWSKHPAYISQNICWWLISIPFIVHGSVLESLRQSVLLLGVNALYYWRAKTEERHLSHDPVYAQYAAWIDKNGFLALCRRFLAGALKPASEASRNVKP